jgi:hypothetical protein
LAGWRAGWLAGWQATLLKLAQPRIANVGINLESLKAVIPTVLTTVQRAAVVWSESAVESAACQECEMPASSSWSPTICQRCDLLFCEACAQRDYSRDDRPSHPDQVLPESFGERFCGLKELSLCDLLLPSVPTQLTKCALLQALDLSNNSLVAVPPLGQLRNLQHLNLSDQRRNWRAGSTHTLADHGALENLSPKLPSATLVSLRLRGLGLVALPLAVTECKRLQLLDLSHNKLTVTTEFPVTFTSATTRYSPHGEINFSACSWLATDLPELETIVFQNAATVMTGAQLIAARNDAELAQWHHLQHARNAQERFWRWLAGDRQHSLLGFGGGGMMAGGVNAVFDSVNSAHFAESGNQHWFEVCSLKLIL